MKMLQITPRDGRRFYDAIVKRQDDIRKGGRGTFSRAGAKRRNATRWKHTKFTGSVEIARGAAEEVNVKIKSRVKADESKMLSAFLRWIDRHFGDRLDAVTIQYR